MYFSKFSRYSITDVLFGVVIPILGVAYVTVAERKTMAFMQRRLGPNKSGLIGSLQPFADAFKLISKETVVPSQANRNMFILGSIITLIMSLKGFLVTPFSRGQAIADYHLGIFYTSACSSLSGYGITVSGWAANSKYAFLGALRSTAQFISYELTMTTCFLYVSLITGSLNLNAIIEQQKNNWNITTLFFILVIFYLASLAETNRPPFDLPEAESELVSGYLTEHAATVFVYFFLGEYSSIVLISLLITILFLGGYLLPKILEKFNKAGNQEKSGFKSKGWLDGGVEGSKTSLLVFSFIFTRASLPRIRFDQLMSICWIILLPMLFGLILVYLIVMVSLDSLPGMVSSFMPSLCLSLRAGLPNIHRPNGLPASTNGG